LYLWLPGRRSGFGSSRFCAQKAFHYQQVMPFS
jgi:hypothetical protein